MASRGAAVDKENVAPAGGPALRSTRRKGLGAMPVSNVQQQEEAAGAEGGSVVKKPAAAVPSDQQQQQLPRLLLFTEKAEEVFMLGSGLPQAKERGELARAVMEDRGSPGAWWRLLQHVGRVFGEPDRCDAKHAAQIRKLYQKATRIIPESLYEQEGQGPALVGIWLGFAAAERRVSESDAKEAYEHMARCGIGARAAAFYLHYAAFEESCGRPDAAIAILTQGLAKGAQPADALRVQLARVKGEEPPASAVAAAAGAAGASSTTSPGAAGLDFDLEGIDLDLASVKSSGSSGSSGSGGAGSSSGGPKPSPPPAAQQQQRQEPSPVAATAAAIAAAAEGSASPTSTVSSTSSSSTASSPPELPPPASVSKAAKQPPAAEPPSSTTKAPPPTPKQPSSQPADGGGGSAVKAGKPGEEKQAPRTASKPKRLVPTGRLLGLGRAERVRPAAEAAAAAKPKEEGGEGGGGSTDTAAAAAAPAPAPPSTPRPAGGGGGAMVAPPSLGRLQPITEDDGTGSGKGSEDTMGAGGGLRSSLPPASTREGEAGNSTETRDLSVRLQKRADDHAHTVIARTPAAKGSIAPSSTPISRATTAPGSAARGGAGTTTIPPPPPTGASSTRLRASPTEPQQQQQQQQPVSMHSQQAYPPAHDADWTHTRDRGRRVGAGRDDGIHNLTADGGQQRQHGSLSEEEHSLTRPSGAARRPHHDPHDDGAAPVAVMAAVPLSASKPRGPSPPAAATAPQPPQPPAPAAPLALGPASASSTASSSSGAGAGFSFEALLASRNFMALNHAQYLRLDVLGRGGSSKVFRVLSDSGQVYALKRVRVPPKDARALESFANEITLLARLRGHPCIIQLVDSHVCRQTGLVLMLMELGEIDLNKLIAQSAAEQAAAGAAPPAATPGTGWRLSLNFIRFVWEQMLRAVQCVHAERIVHGDLKPANFVFVKGRLKLIDFGIAKALGNDTTNIMRESQVGTVNYMSPEAILDTGGGREHGGRRAPCMKIGRASDVWSLGCILYQLVYGKTPFAELNLIQKLHCIVDDGYRIPFPNEEALHPDVLDTIRRCLRRDPTQRPPIAGGAGSLLGHPFLCSGVSAAAAAAAVTDAPPPLLSEGARRSVVEATLAVVDSDPAVLRLEGVARIGAVCERVGGLLGGEEAAAAAVGGRREGEEEEAAAPAAAAAAGGGAGGEASPRKDGGGVVEVAADHTGDSSGSSTGGHPNTWSFN